ncbi:MAG: hypothetical protein U1E60_14685 [Reyranellaceae bacterium]
MTRRSKAGRLTQHGDRDPFAEIQPDFNPAQTTKPSGVKPRPLTGAERYRHEDMLMSRLALHAAEQHRRQAGAADPLAVASGEAERRQQVRKLAEAADKETTRPGRGSGLDPDAARFAHLMDDGRDGEPSSRSVSHKEQVARYAASLGAEEELTARQAWYYSRGKDDVE